MDKIILPAKSTYLVDQRANNDPIEIEIYKSDDVSDGYHTFGELYEHRITLYIALCRIIIEQGLTNVWRSKVHSDGTSWDGWFIVGINTTQDNQITYHLPLDKWEETDFIPTMSKAPTFDGHTSEDVLDRLKTL